MRMILFFIDGFGLGEMDANKNPLVVADTPNLQYIFENFTVIPTDATLGIAGLPQSATGQTAIFTGINAPEILGRHLHGQPTVTLKKVINDDNLFKALISMGLKVTNANVYRKAYLNNMFESNDKRERPSASTLMSMSCGLRFRTVDDYNRGEGLYHDITGQLLVKNGFSDREISPMEAAKRLYTISREYDFTLFEHFMTDIVGHRSEIKYAANHIELIDSFLGSLLELVDLNKDIIIITSDHGNIEDMSVKTHTYNKVPTIIISKIPEMLEIKNNRGCTDIKSLTDIAPAIIEIFKKLNKCERNF